jgi:hypothetical protein
LIGLIDTYNEQVAIPKNISQIERSSIFPGNSSSLVEFPCKVAIIGNQTYGKFPLTGVND